MKQGTDAWRTCRLGKVTASRLNDVLATIKTGEAATRRDYKMQLVVERLTGEPTGSYTNGYMQWGVDNEDSARDCYSFATGNEVEQVGFIDHPTIEGFGASPDGLVGEDGLLEIKCPKTHTHVTWMLAGVVPSEHLNQIQGQLACTGRKWCHFVSYDPRLPIDMQLFIVRVERDEVKIATIETSVKIILGEISDITARLLKLSKV